MGQTLYGIFVPLYKHNVVALFALFSLTTPPLFFYHVLPSLR